MLLIFLCAGMVLLSSPGAAIRWDFDDGTTQGWGAKKPIRSGGNHLFFSLSGAVEAGVWRINAFRTDGLSGAGVTLISPTIGHDSYLFDRVRVRFRTVHSSPTTGALLLQWTNEHNLMFPGSDPLPRGRFYLQANGDYGEFVYTTQWQEVEFSLTDMAESSFGYERLWEGLLDDIRLLFGLEDMTLSMTNRPASTKVSALEVDWIELTGVEEVLQGELPRSPVFDLGVEGPKVFAPPVFYPIARDLGPFRLFGDSQEEVLTDLDGDGDLDLFAFWGGIEGGWVMARNNGQGAFETIRLEPLEELMYDRRMRVGDVTGDGQDEIVMGFERWEEWDLGVWAISAEFPARTPRAEVQSSIGGRSRLGWRWAGGSVYPTCGRRRTVLGGVGLGRGRVDVLRVADSRSGFRAIVGASDRRFYRRWDAGSAVGAGRVAVARTV